jgi:hypothetical protein
MAPEDLNAASASRLSLHAAAKIGAHAMGTSPGEAEESESQTLM